MQAKFFQIQPGRAMHLKSNVGKQIHFYAFLLFLKFSLKALHMLQITIKTLDSPLVPIFTIETIFIVSRHALHLTE